MKRIYLVLVIALSAISTVPAQNWGNGRSYSQPVTINGTLQLQNGFIAVAAGNTVYYVPVLERYVGFIDGLKEGSQITVEGYVYHNNLSYVQPSKVTVNGKTYDMPVQNLSMGPRDGYGYRRNNRGGGGSCCW